MAKHGENWMAIAQARAFLIDVCAIVEREDHGFCDYQVYQNRHNGAIWGEGIRVDTGESAHGCYFNYVGICYYVNHHDENGGRACIRRIKMEDGCISTDLPFHGSAQEAADYLLENYRKYYED